MPNLVETRQRIAELKDEAAKLDETIGEADMTDEQAQRVDDIYDELAVCKKQEKAQMRLEAVRGSEESTTDTPAAEMSGPRSRIERMPHPLDSKGGFKSFGDYALSVFQWDRRDGASTRDDRLAKLQPTTNSNTGVPAEGGHAVPPDFRENIRQALTGPDSLLPRMDRYETQFQEITLPKDDRGPWGTAGPQATWKAEAAKLDQSKVDIQQRQVKLHKLTTLMPVTDELLNDAPGMNSYINRKAPDVIRFALDTAIVAGTGDGNNQPTGFLGHASEVAVNRTTANQIKYADIQAMLKRMPPSYFRQSFWLCNSDVIPELMSISFRDGTTTPVPVWLPNFQIEAEPYGRLMGRPVVAHEAIPGLGSKGDLILMNGSMGYIALTKGGEDLRQDISIHLYFDYDVHAFRWIMRFGGKPWLDAPIARADTGNTNTWSHTVVLDVVAGP